MNNKQRKTNVLTYKEYTGVFWFDPEIDMFDGDVIGTSDIITFRGRSIDELRQALKDSIDDYLEFCVELGKKPEKPYSGRFNVRLNPQVHRAVALAAQLDGESLNAWVAKTLEKESKNRLGAERRG